MGFKTKRQYANTDFICYHVGKTDDQDAEETRDLSTKFHFLLLQLRGAQNALQETILNTTWPHLRCLTGILLLASTLSAPLSAAAAPRLWVGKHDIGGTVSGPQGPEAGVWVIAETHDLPTGFARIVTTNDKGEFLIPDLPKAAYQVWVRGYGLVDSDKQTLKTGKRVALQAKPAPSPAAAAYYYPGVYWYSMLHIPEASEFPGTGDNGIDPAMKQQSYWIDSLKNSCQSCHALGSPGIRKVPELFSREGDSVAAWTHRTQAGQAMTNMALTLGRMGPGRALKEFANWTDRIAAGELPFAAPQRPTGVERNLVITEWDWSSNRAYLHDAVSSDKRNPRVNANGMIYGSTEESTDWVPVLDPVHHVASQIKHPYLDPKTPSSLDLPKGESAYWQSEQIWDGHTSIHNPIMDDQGRVWFTARVRSAANPDACKDGSVMESAKVAPQKDSVRQLSMYDPKTGQWSLIDTCFTTQHLYFGYDTDNTLWTSAGQPWGGVVGWLNTRQYLKTGDALAAQAWAPIVVDVNGNGKRDSFVGPKDAVDPAQDKWVSAGFYGVQPSPVDNSVWGQSMDVGFSRVDQPSYLIHLMPGDNPPNSALSEIFRPPEGAFGARGVDVDSQGVAWTALASGQLASFDRRKCSGPLGGVDAATGRVCPEGWKLYTFPGPQFQGVSTAGSADHAYYVWVDRFNTLGLGRDVPIAMSNGGEALLALVDEKFVNLHVPYPLSFYSKNADGRIDDPKAGWRGKGLWSTSGTRANFHGEGGKDARPKVFKFQIRPDPLSH